MASATVRSAVLPPHGASVAITRRFITSALADAGVSDEDVVDDVVLAACELVTNAVLHARSVIQVSLELRDDAVRVTVEDQNRTLPLLRDYGAAATTGRGLALVSALAADVGARHTANGKAVWFTVPHLPTQRTGATGSGRHDGATHLPLSPQVPTAHDGSTAALDGVPVGWWRAARRHEEAALRELALFHGDALAPTMDAWTWFGDSTTALTRVDAPIERALTGDAPPTSLRVDVSIADGLAQQVERLLATLSEADGRAQAGELLIPTTPAPLRAVRSWRFGEVLRQAAGMPPTTWRAYLEREQPGLVALAGEPAAGSPPDA